jgi:hypothetical protein
MATLKFFNVHLVENYLNPIDLYLTHGYAILTLGAVGGVITIPQGVKSVDFFGWEYEFHFKEWARGTPFVPPPSFGGVRVPRFHAYPLYTTSV